MKGRTVQGRNPMRNDLLELQHQEDGDDEGVDDADDDDGNNDGNWRDKERMVAHTGRLRGAAIFC